MHSPKCGINGIPSNPMRTAPPLIPLLRRVWTLKSQVKFYLQPKVKGEMRSMPHNKAGLEEHRFGFVYNQFVKNLQRGIKEGLYREKIHKEIYAKLHIVNIDAIINGSIFPWPEFKFETVFLETFRIHIRAITNDAGLNYFKTHLLNINE